MRDGATRLARLRTSGSAKCLFPRRRDGVLEAVLLNTAGGWADGDRFDVQATAQAGAHLVVTTQAAERVYRAKDQAPAEIDVHLTADPGARLEWLPQETILFDGGRVRRRLRADLAANAELVLTETLVLGRRAMGETVGAGLFVDLRRVYCDGRLLHADALALEGAIARELAAAATFGGASAAATLLYVGGAAQSMAERMRDVARTSSLLADAGVRAGASSWNGIALARLLAPEAAALKRALAACLAAVRRAPPPVVWSL